MEDKHKTWEDIILTSLIQHCFHALLHKKTYEFKFYGLSCSFYTKNVVLTYTHF